MQQNFKKSADELKLEYQVVHNRTCNKI